MEGYSFITLTENGACNLLPRRDILSHKGSFGTLLIASGSENYIGAASLCTESALKSGAGIVCLASVRMAVSVCATRCPEATYLICDEKDGQISADSADKILEKAKKSTAMLIGCGLGNTENSAKLVSRLLSETAIPRVVDADGLNCICSQPQLLKNSIITPHAGEMARLCGCDIADIKADPAKTALDFAQKYSCVVVLKDADTIIASPDGKLFLNMGRNSGLAKGGSGDVLAGITASLLAQGMKPFECAMAAVTLHSMAAKRCAQRYSERGMLPHEICESLREIFAEHKR